MLTGRQVKIGRCWHVPRPTTVYSVMGLAAAPARCNAEPFDRVVHQPQPAVVEAEADAGRGEPGILRQPGGLIRGTAYSAGSGMRPWPPT